MHGPTYYLTNLTGEIPQNLPSTASLLIYKKRTAHTRFNLLIPGHGIVEGLDIGRRDELEGRLPRDLALRLTHVTLLKQELAVQVGRVDGVQVDLK